MKRALFLFLLVMNAEFAFGQTPASTTSNQVFPRAHTSEGFAICGSCKVPSNISSKVTLAPLGEPGERIVISGTIYQADGVTAAAGITLFLYQTDAGGYYHRPKEDVFSPSLHGWLHTGADGHYEIHTIRPKPEVLAEDEPAHIHAQVFGKGIPEHFLHEFWFAGDPRIKTGEAKKLGRLGRFSPILRLEKDPAGLLSAVCDIRLKPTAPWQYESP